VHLEVRALTTTMGVQYAPCMIRCSSVNQLAVATNFRLRRKQSRRLIGRSFGPPDHGKDRVVVASN
jgi:hypothetical protein